MKKYVEVEYINESFGTLPIYDLVEGKSWAFQENRWVFTKGVRAVLWLFDVNSKDEIIEFISKSTAFLPNSRGYIIAFLYSNWPASGSDSTQYRQIGLIFIEDKHLDPFYPQPDKLPSKVKRQPPIIYTREQFYKIKTENIFGKDIANFESNGILVEFDYRGTLSPEQFLYLERPTIHTNGDKFHISYECEDLPFYNSISKKT